MTETKREGYIRRIESALKTDVTEITHEIFFTEEAAREILELLKEQPERKKGEWIFYLGTGYGNPYGHFECSLCGDGYGYKTDFCPTCGADMRGEQDGKK